METYFHITYEFDRDTVHNRLRETVQQGKAGYICVADGNVLTHVHRDKKYRHTVGSSLFSICDSSWVPLYLTWLYGIRRDQYCGAQIFQDIVQGGEYRMAFLGGSAGALRDLRSQLQEINPAIEGMPFIELPYCAVEQFDYRSIAAQLDSAQVDIIWVALGAPKQERFMELLKPHLSKGVMIGVGAVFNFYSGHVHRAPAWLRALHLEFVYRILTEPRKQMARCASILATLPAIFLEEKSLHRHVIE